MWNGEGDADNSTPNVAVALPEMPHKSDPEATFYWSIKFHFFLLPSFQQLKGFWFLFLFYFRRCINIMEGNNAVILFRKLQVGFKKRNRNSALMGRGWKGLEGIPTTKISSMYILLGKDMCTRL